MNKLLVFDKTTKEIVARHNFWEQHFTIDSNWEDFDSESQVALIVATDIPEVMGSFRTGDVIQPQDYNVSVSTPCYVSRAVLEAERLDAAAAAAETPTL